MRYVRYCKRCGELFEAVTRRGRICLSCRLPPHHTKIKKLIEIKKTGAIKK